MKRIELLSAANAAVNQTSIGVDLGDAQGYSVEVAFSSGTLNGTLTLEASVGGTNYATITGSSQAIASGATHIYNITDAEYPYVRLKWVASSGTGTVTALHAIKEIIK